jgi:DNA-binding NarL/FixJ family response regulator
MARMAVGVGTTAERRCPPLRQVVVRPILPAKAAMPRSHASTAPVRVLLVDDQERCLRVARDVVAATPGFTLAGAVGSGAAALERVAEDPPDLVLADVRMPEMDGFALARLIAAKPPAPLVVLVSAEDVVSLGGADRVIECGAVGFMPKERLTPAALRATWGLP